MYCKIKPVFAHVSGKNKVVSDFKVFEEYKRFHDRSTTE